MSNQEENTQTSLEIKLQNLRDTPERDVVTAARQRSAFIEKTKSIKTLRQNSNSVSPAIIYRHIEWKHLLFRKEGRKMSFITTLLIVMGLVFGGTGVTVAAAQSAMPDDFLYPVKLVSEDVALSLNTNPEAAYNTELALTQRRAEEMVQLALREGVYDEEAAQRLMLRIDHALRTGSSLDGEEMPKAMLQMQNHLQTMLQVMEQSNLSTEAQQQMTRLMTQIQNRIETLQQTQNMEELRLRIHAGKYNGEDLGQKNQLMNENKNQINNPSANLDITPEPVMNKGENQNPMNNGQMQGNGPQSNYDGTITPGGPNFGGDNGQGPFTTPQKNKP